MELKYGLRDNQLVHIDDVISGKACNCFCPGCLGPLLAKKGRIREHHFAHIDSDCQHGVESALHFLAKEVIEKSGQITLAAVTLAFNSNREDLVVYPEQTVSIDRVEIERSEGGIRPDLILHVGTSQLLVEIYVTHKVDKAKRKYLRENLLSCIEIDLSKVPRDIDIEALSSLILGNTDNKKWLFNKKGYLKRIELQQIAINREIHWSANKRTNGSQRRHLVDNCPLKHRNGERDTTADAMWECLYCACCIDHGNSVLCVESLAD
ncbi:hypothetical protein CAG70_00290 [Photobacterium halotolerans]|uniref:competence protein CoiA family protein n=1 Tax=Photobacterium halotolerans TaxID=265726 RepID=UPI001373180B|nr:hypothetical protein [Photobacterium halotolerans]NAX45449.1 hypothetical protein [Photobacterium halotolerans]